RTLSPPICMWSYLVSFAGVVVHLLRFPTMFGDSRARFHLDRPLARPAADLLVARLPDHPSPAARPNYLATGWELDLIMQKLGTHKQPRAWSKSDKPAG